jgi:hypothetical protein
MKVVSRFEANLLHLLHHFLGRTPREQALPLLEGSVPTPRGLSPVAVELIQEALAKGCMRWLVQAGGWQPARHLRDGRVAEGRLWQRTTPNELGLKFSRNTLRFLLWITAKNPAVEKTGWCERGLALTVADLLVLFLAYAALRHPEHGHPLRQRLSYRSHGLCWLAYPADFAGLPEAKPDYAPWTSGLGACIVEALQPLLAKRWIAQERAKALLKDWHELQQVGQSQERALSPFLDAVEAAGRRDLAGFLMQTAAVLLADDAGPTPWSARLEDAGPRLAERGQTYRAMLFLPHQVERLRRWEHEARAVGYLDEGYAASQFWKAEWARWEGETLYVRAQAVMQRLDPLGQT